MERVAGIRGTGASIIAIQIGCVSSAGAESAEIPHGTYTSIVTQVCVIRVITPATRCTGICCARVSIIAWENAFRRLAEASETFFSDGTKITVIAWFFRVTNHTSHRWSARFVCTENAVITHDICRSRCADLVIAIIAKGTEVPIVARRCICNNDTTQHGVTRFVSTWVIVFTEILISDTFPIVTDVEICTDIVIAASALDGCRLTAHSGLACVGGTFIAIVAIQRDTCETISIDAGPAGGAWITVITSE